MEKQTFTAAEFTLLNALISRTHTDAVNMGASTPELDALAEKLQEMDA
jgi:hypothetical protein